MNRQARCRAVVGVAVGMALVAIASPRALATRMSEPPLDPKTYRSASGHFTLYVNPSQRRGQGPGEYCLRKDGQKVWQKELPFTLCDVRLLDDGTAAGYGYTLGLEGYGGKTREDYGELVIAIFDPQGKVRLKESLQRGHQPRFFLDQYPQPEVEHLVVDTENDRVIVILEDWDVNRQSSQWRQYRLSTGKLLGQSHPKEKMADYAQLHWAHAPRPLPGTSFFLVQWFRSEDDPRLKGTHFAVIDSDGRPIWQRTLRDDYTIPNDEAAEERLWKWFRTNGAILSVESPGRFDLYFAKLKQRVSFAVKHDPEDKWIVTETGRKDYSPPEEPANKKPDDAATQTVPKSSLEYLGAVKLGGDRKSEKPFSALDTLGFAVDGKGRFAFTRKTGEKTADFARVDQNGAVVNRVPLPALDREEPGWNYCAWLDGDRFVVLSHGRENHSRAAIVDFARGQATVLASFTCPSVEAVAGLRDGGFAVLATLHSKYTMTEELRAYDAEGRLQWTVGEGTPEGLFSPEDLCVTADGLIAVVQTIREQVKFYDRQGTFHHLIDLTKAWGREPQYPAGIAALPNGELIVADAVHSGGPFVHMDAKGKILGEFRLHFPDGRRLSSGLTAAPDGRLWASYGAAFAEIDKKGTVARVVGESPTAERLEEISAATMDRQGRLYVLDKATYNVHVFSPEGKRLFVCQPNPDDAEADSSASPNITVSDAGEIFVQRPNEDGYIHFSSTGKRLGIEPRVNPDDVAEEWYFQPGTGRRWVKFYKTIALVDPQGRIVKTIERRPNNEWLDGLDGLDVAPDGSMVLVDRSGIRSFQGDSKPSVNLYAADGTPLRTFPSLIDGFHSVACDGRFIAATSFDGPLFLWDTAGKAVARLDLDKRLTSNIVRYLFFSPDGKELRVLDGVTKTVHRFSLPEAASENRPLQEEGP